MDNIFLTGLIALLAGAVGLLSYNLGRKVEKNAEYNRKADAIRTANTARDSLRDPAVVERLHEHYRR